MLVWTILCFFWSNFLFGPTRLYYFRSRSKSYQCHDVLVFSPCSFYIWIYFPHYKFHFVLEVLVSLYFPHSLRFHLNINSQGGVVYSNKVVIMSSILSKGRVIHSLSHGLDPTLSIYKWVGQSNARAGFSISLILFEVSYIESIVTLFFHLLSGTSWLFLLVDLTIPPGIHPKTTLFPKSSVSKIWKEKQFAKLYCSSTLGYLSMLLPFSYVCTTGYLS